MEPVGGSPAAGVSSAGLNSSYESWFLRVGTEVRRRQLIRQNPTEDHRRGQLRTAERTLWR
jgi:hypothetical protein